MRLNREEVRRPGELGNTWEIAQQNFRDGIGFGIGIGVWETVFFQGLMLGFSRRSLVIIVCSILLICLPVGLYLFGKHNDVIERFYVRFEKRADRFWQSKAGKFLLWLLNTAAVVAMGLIFIGTILQYVD